MNKKKKTLLVEIYLAVSDRETGWHIKAGKRGEGEGGGGRERGREGEREPVTEKD